jgi:monoamine oxidase
MQAVNGRSASQRSSAVKLLSRSELCFGVKGGDVPEPRKILLQDWAKEEWIWGAPCPVLGLGQLVKGGMEVIKLPFRSFHFVGTETTYVWKGYMEGAVRFGRRGG